MRLLLATLAALLVAAAPASASERTYKLRFGPIALGDLAPGAVRPVTQRELAALHRIASEAKDALAHGTEAGA